MSTTPKIDRTTHTPGPWKVAARLYSDKRGVICVEHPCWDAIDVITPQWSNSSTPDEHQANARLIAAAPEMYEALKAIIGHGYCEMSGHGSQDYVSKKAILAARAALAKAEGGK